MSAKTPGEMFYEALQTGRDAPSFSSMSQSNQDAFQRMAAEYEKTRFALPDDVEAFVAEADARSALIPRHDSETWEAFVAEVVTGHERVGGMVAEVVGFVGIESDAAAALSHAPNDAQRLIAIIRAQQEELRQTASFEQSVVSANRELGEMNAKLNDDNDTLRDRLAKLENAAAKLYESSNAMMRSGPIAREVMRPEWNAAMRVTREILEAKGTESGTTETNEERKQ